MAAASTILAEVNDAFSPASELEFGFDTQDDIATFYVGCCGA